MPRRKLEVVPDEEVPIEPEAVPREDEAPPYLLETLNEDALSQLKIWGNSTIMAVDKLRPLAPEWSRFIDDVFQMIRAHVQEHTQ